MIKNIIDWWWSTVAEDRAANDPNKNDISGEICVDSPLCEQAMTQWALRRLRDGRNVEFCVTKIHVTAEHHDGYVSYPVLTLSDCFRQYTSSRDFFAPRDCGNAGDTVRLAAQADQLNRKRTDSGIEQIAGPFCSHRENDTEWRV